VGNSGAAIGHSILPMEFARKAQLGKILSGWVKLLHVPVPLHLRLIPVDTPFRLTCEGKKVLVDNLGSQAVASMLLSSLDMMVHHVLCLEPLITAFIGAGEWALASVTHHMLLQFLIGGQCRCTARVGAG